MILILSLLVVILSNPIYALICLILVFFNSAVFLLSINVNFLAMIYLIIYIGAIAILFLFVVMLLNVRIVELYSSLQYHIPIGAVAGICFMVLLGAVCYHEFKTFFITF